MRLDCGVDRMARQMRGIGGGAPGEGTQVQEPRHARAVVDGPIVPQAHRSPQFVRDAREMRGADLLRADFLAGPVDADRRIETEAQIAEIIGRAGGEDHVQHRIVRIIGRAGVDARRAGGGGAEIDHVGLSRGEIGHVAAQIVEQDRQIVDADRVEIGDAPRQIGARGIVERMRRAIGSQRDAEAHARAAHLRRQTRQRPGLRRVVGDAPVAAQCAIALRPVMVEGIAHAGERGDHMAALIGGPQAAEAPLDHAKVGAGGRGGSGHAGCIPLVRPGASSAMVWRTSVIPVLYKSVARRLGSWDGRRRIDIRATGRNDHSGQGDIRC